MFDRNSKVYKWEICWIHPESIEIAMFQLNTWIHIVNASRSILFLSKKFVYHCEVVVVFYY